METYKTFRCLFFRNILPIGLFPGSYVFWYSPKVHETQTIINTYGNPSSMTIFHFPGISYCLLIFRILFILRIYFYYIETFEKWTKKSAFFEIILDASKTARFLRTSASVEGARGRRQQEVCRLLSVSTHRNNNYQNSEIKNKKSDSVDVKPCSPHWAA